MKNLILAFFFILCGLVLPFHSQTNSIQSEITGEIVNSENGAVIVGAKVTVEGKNFRREAKTNDEGRYEIKVPFGTFKITVEAIGFRKYKRKNVVLKEKEAFTLNINLKYGKPIIVDAKHP